MTKAAIWNQLKTEYEYSSSFLNKLYGVTYQQASKELLESLLEQLQKEVGQGVNESLSTDVVGVAGNDLITDTNASLNQDEVNSSEDIWNYKIIQSSWNPDFYHMWMYEGEKSYYYFHTDNMVAEIKLQDLETKVTELNSKVSTKSVTVQSCGTWNNIFTCNDMELDKLLTSQYYQLNRDNIMQRSLSVAEIHPQAIKQQEILKEWQQEVNNYIVVCSDYPQVVIKDDYNIETTSTIVATKTSDNNTEFKGIPIEHVTKYDIGLDYPETINDVLLTKFPNYWLVNKSEDVLQFNSFSNAVKHIKEWLGEKQQKVPSTEEAIQPSPLERKSIYA